MSHDNKTEAVELNTSGLQMIAMERMRQIHSEGYDSNRDARYVDGELATAACAYSLPSPTVRMLRLKQEMWPWAPSTFKPAANPSVDSRIHELTKAGALIAAEIDRLQAAKGRGELS